MMEIQKYNPEPGNRGLEVTYARCGLTLFIKIPGSNHWTDYARHILGAWPRVGGYIRWHRTWNKWANRFLRHLRTYGALEGAERVEIMGHSMGGSVAVIMGSRIRETYVKVTTVNAPKTGNWRAMRLAEKAVELHTLYDVGDIVRKLPLFYAEYPPRGKRWYDRTYGWGKAHNHMPFEWDAFPI